MSKSKKPDMRTDNASQLPEVLASVREAAVAHTLPELDDDTASICPRLFEIMAPRMVPSLTQMSQGKPIQVWREPMMSVVWDRSVGAFRWMVSDKVLNFRLSANAVRLPTLIVEIETAIADGKVSTKEIKPT
jgi:hypothetical protein